MTSSISKAFLDADEHEFSGFIGCHHAGIMEMRNPVEDPAGGEPVNA